MRERLYLNYQNSFIGLEQACGALLDVEFLEVGSVNHVSVDLVVFTHFVTEINS